jgi:hypothetical protein
MLEIQECIFLRYLSFSVQLIKVRLFSSESAKIMHTFIECVHEKKEKN